MSRYAGNKINDSRTQYVAYNYFDEIDSGVSGQTAAKVGNILKKLSENHQVIAITHLPQIAARGEEHIHVEKTEADDKMQTTLRKLNSDERIGNNCPMISDEN